MVGAFGSIGDFIGVGDLAYELWQACRNAGDDYKDLTQLCNSVWLAVNRCQPLDPRSIVRRQDATVLRILSDDCKSTLERLRSLLNKYQGMEELKNFHKRIGFYTTKSEREEVRSKLSGQLAVINTFISGVSVDLQKLSVALLAYLVRNNNVPGSTLDVSAILSDDMFLQKMLNEFSIEDNDTKSKLETKEKEIKDSLLEASTNESNSVSRVLDPEQGLALSPTGTTTAFSATGPVSAKMAVYNPFSIPWFTPSVRIFFPVITMRDAFQSEVILPSPTIPYSAQDEFLCGFQEGWTLIRTMEKRGLQSEEAYYLSYNNLSCSRSSQPVCSRLYFLKKSLIPARDNTNMQARLGTPTSNSNLQFDTNGVLTYYSGLDWRLSLFNSVTSSQASPSNPLGMPSKVACMGFMCPFNLPLDLSDEVSNQFAHLHFSNHGRRIQYSDEHIDKSLPDGWRWRRDKTGKERHTYIYMGSTPHYETTVHPSRFFLEDDPVPVQLPPGWERRLDVDGNLFFVDHNTLSTTRLDPRFNRDINQDSGLTGAWKSITDHKGRPFYYEQVGTEVIGAYNPSVMKTRAMDGKLFLKRVPNLGDKPSDLLKYPKKGDQSEVPEMTTEERQRYDSIFRKVKKQNKYKITQDEAETYLKDNGLPLDVCSAILKAHDVDRNNVYVPVEFANALHLMRFVLEGMFKEISMPSPTENDLEEYDKEFQTCLGNEDALEATKSQVLTISDRLGLPQSVAEPIWIQSDSNKDLLWDIIEFSAGYHKILSEATRWKLLSVVGGHPMLPRSSLSSNQTQGANKELHKGNRESIKDSQQGSDTRPSSSSNKGPDIEEHNHPEGELTETDDLPVRQ